ncbi:GCN5 family acetyltransferase [Rhodanobacter thiooxydans]|uniref:GCN5 family acetyltransferase n=1 Tax=Rhodanobacter thiooxydans TaxID=416169 RepID=A0A154QHE6_9GAMM|nr:GNAT family N-acetyltransferase [Rhodanobacter thiooxydans]EIL97081.1 acetyltransferase [Rhodanobacter thiooxydans LCS2]KZC23685.1 GCN5 family acetyltransferase [Rhodanobacter thiooxydans]MCW0202970.1 GNAT family N-acetyltransferase [Rhodanobacter thiooxydans]
MPTLPPPLPQQRRDAAAAAGVRVRRSVVTDLDALVALELRSFDGDRLSRAQYRRHLDSDSALVLVASANHHLLLGSAVLFFRKGSGIARLYSLATAPEARGQGVGTALLAAVVDAARRRGSRALKLEVRTDNAAAIRLYERHGFRRSGRYAHYYEDGADAWRYEQTLG